MNLYAEIALPLPLPQLFTYRCPPIFHENIQPGMRVLVPFTNKKMTGYVIELVTTTKVENLKDIIDLLDAEPALDAHLLELTRWISNYYLCAWGEAIRNALPVGPNLTSKQILSYNPKPSMLLFENTLDKTRPLGRMLSIMQERQHLSVHALRRLMGKTEGFNNLLGKLIQSGDVTVSHQVTKSAPRKQLQKAVNLVVDNDEATERMAEFPKQAIKRASCLEFLLSKGEPVLLTVLDKAGFNSSIARWLVDNNLAEYCYLEVFRDPLDDDAQPFDLAKTLTADQQSVFNGIKAAVDQGAFQTMLVHGVTGSGKTRVYIEACEYVRRLGKQALVLVPEIALTPQMIHRFQAMFQDRVGVWHSRLSEGERYDIWRRVRDGAYDVMIGTRSALFLPLKKLGFIVVDEEHEHSFKQDTSPRYQGRDVAIMRAKLLNAVCVLGSATPSLESYYNAQQKRYTLLELPKRIADRPMPPVNIIDMRSQPFSSRISPILRQKIQTRLDNREGIILFLNRRGYSTLVMCYDCGYSFDCINCHVTLTYHAVGKHVKCHYCNYTKSAPERCQNCGSFHLSYRGSGTQRIEDEVQRLFPAARILRLDVDAAARKRAHGQILKEFKNGLADILLGTQMVAKGLDFPHVTLVGVVSADISLNLPDFRSAERTFQLITQVAGRAGRGEKGGEVVVQTFSPHHYAILTARTHDYHSFYNREIRERQELGYPPFNRVICVLITSVNETQVIQVAEVINQELRKISHPSLVDVLGPAPAPISKIKGKFRWQIFIKSDNHIELRRKIYEVVIPINARHEDVGVVVNVDPVGL